MAPSNGTTSTQPKLVVTLPPTIAHYNGTLRRHPAMAPPAPSNATQIWHHVHSTIAHYNGTPRRLHPAMAFWCHVQCAKVVRRPPPLLEVRTPIAMAIWGKNILPTILYLTIEVLSKHVGIYVPFYVLLQCLLVYGIWFKSSWLKWFLCVCVCCALWRKNNFITMHLIWAIYYKILHLNLSAVLGPGFPYFSLPSGGDQPAGKVAINCPDLILLTIVEDDCQSIIGWHVLIDSSTNSCRWLLGLDLI